MQQQQNKFILYLVILLGFAGGYFYYSQLGGSVSVPPAPAIQSSNDLQKFKDLSIDFSILKDQNYVALKVYGDLSVQPGTSGKSDMFQAY